MNTVWYHLCVEPKNKQIKLIKTVSSIVVARAGSWGEWEDVVQRVHAFGYKMNKFGGCNVQHGNYS